MQIIYITTSSKEEALKISHILVEENLVACTNIFDHITSVYKWEGSVRKDTEFAIIAKTKDENVKPAIARVKELHSYDCPCIISIKIANGEKNFIKYVEKLN